MADKNKQNRSLIFQACFFVIVIVLTMIVASSKVQATEVVAQTGTITFDDEGLTDVSVSLYKVAVYDKNDNYTPKEKFAAYSVDLFNKNAAATLQGYVERDKIAPDATGVTDETGCCEFTYLTEGVYLILAEDATQDGITYTSMPVMVSMPEIDEDSIKWEFTANGKHEQKPVLTELTVLKVWDESHEEGANRPESIEVQLLRDGYVKETIKLSAGNNWTYTWPELEANATWSVVEAEVPEDYVVSVEKNGSTTVITNDYEPERPYDEPPTEEEEEKTEEEPDNPDTPEKPKLPQTGQLWWPVLVLVCGGMLMLIIGIKAGEEK